MKDFDDKIDIQYQQYSKKMFSFNTRTRERYYEHDIKGGGYDHCFDCAREIDVFSKYKDVNKDKLDLKTYIVDQSKMTNDLFRNHYTLRIV